MSKVRSIKDGMYYVALILEYICHAAENNITYEELYVMAQQCLGPLGEQILVTIAEQLRKEGYEQAMAGLKTPG